MNIDKNEVYIPFRGDFSTALVVLQTPDAYYYRSQGLWELITPIDTESFLDETILRKVSPEDVEQIIELWDESDGLSPTTEDNWTTTELSDFVH